jgi:tripartite-type tricarboxylate transporter receptor subunit TctC
MQSRHRHVLAAALLAASLGLVPDEGAAQKAWPTQPVSINVPAAAGGPSDAVARLLAEAMSRALGQQVIVENFGGAGGTIGMGRVARAKPDGYTLLLYHIALATSPALYDNLPFEARDFESIGRVTDVPMTVVGRENLAAKDITELLAWLKEKKTGVSYGHAGIGSASHLCGLLMMNALGTTMTEVPYRGTGPAMNDLLGGQIDVMCDQTTTTTSRIKEGKIKGYAVTTRKRVTSLPDLPTLEEAGVTGFEVTAWHGLWAPKGAPKEVIDKLASALQAALQDPKVIERFATLGTEPVPAEQVTPAALKGHLEAELAKWGPIIKAAGVKAN